MDIITVRRGGFCICGSAVETTLENNDADISKLYADFFASGLDKTLCGLPGAGAGYYGLEWYAENHKSFFYLLGREVSGGAPVPEGSVMKQIPPGFYAVTRLPAGSGLIEAWTEFFYDAVPAAGLAPDESHGFYFEYCPKDVRGECELWVPVVRK